MLLESLQHVDAVLWTGGEDLAGGILRVRLERNKGRSMEITSITRHSAKRRCHGVLAYYAYLRFLRRTLWEDDAGVHGTRYPDVMMDSLKAIYDEVSKSSLPLQLAHSSAVAQIEVGDLPGLPSPVRAGLRGPIRGGADLRHVGHGHLFALHRVGQHFQTS